jgi:hypothetical protein
MLHLVCVSVQGNLHAAYARLPHTERLSKPKKQWELTPAYDSTDGQREALTGLTRENFTKPGRMWMRIWCPDMTVEKKPFRSAETTVCYPN